MSLAYFSIIAQRLTIITLVSSIILTAIGWETKTGISLGGYRDQYFLYMK